jgi:hypothetical protein
MEWRRGKAEAMLENALERYVQWEEPKADGAGPLYQGAGALACLFFLLNRRIG